jgi:hypothetical protein
MPYMPLIDRLPLLYREHLEHEAKIAATPKAPDFDRTGCATSGSIHALRFRGVAEFVLNRDVGSFRSRLSAAAKLKLEMFVRAEAGEPIDWSYLTLLNYQDVLNGLAAGDFETAARICECVLKRPAKEIRKCHRFDVAIGSVIMSAVLDDKQELPASVARFSELCQEKGNKDFIGYSGTFECLLQSNVDPIQEYFEQIIAGHKRQSKRGVFNCTEDEVLCVWGIGVANLARSRGMIVNGIPPLIPTELLC